MRTKRLPSKAVRKNLFLQLITKDAMITMMKMMRMNQIQTSWKALKESSIMMTLIRSTRGQTSTMLARSKR
jgi:hypothetical protein